MLQQGQALRRKDAVTSDAEDAESGSDENDEEQIIHESTSRKRTLEDMEGSLSEDNKGDEMEKDVDSEADNAMADAAVSGSSKRGSVQINPSQYLVLENQQSGGGEAKVALAFAGDDDVVAEFTAEKQKVIEHERPKDIDLRLPGWGEWSGPGIIPSARRKKRSAMSYLLLIVCMLNHCLELDK